MDEGGGANHSRRLDSVPSMNVLLRSSLFAITLRGASGFVPLQRTLSSPPSSFVTRNMSLNAKPFAVIVQAEIQPDRLEEFIQLIEENAVQSRQEPGCLRFGTF